MNINKKLILISLIIFLFFSFYFIFKTNQSNIKQKQIINNLFNFLKSEKNKTIKETPTITPDLKINTIYKQGWKLYKNDVEKFQFFYPEYFQLNSIKKNENPGLTMDTLILNHKITFGIKNYSEIDKNRECKGDCPVIQSENDLIINNYQVKKIKGIVGAIGGNIPFSFITYEIKFPDEEKFFFMSYSSIPKDLSYQQLLEKYGPIGDTEIAIEDEKILEEIVLTFKFIK